MNAQGQGGRSCQLFRDPITSAVGNHVCVAATSTGAIAIIEIRTWATDTEIKTRQHLPYSGPQLFRYGVIGKTEAEYFKKDQCGGRPTPRRKNSFYLIMMDAYSRRRRVNKPANGLKETKASVHSSRYAVQLSNSKYLPREGAASAVRFTPFEVETAQMRDSLDLNRCLIAVGVSSHRVLTRPRRLHVPSSPDDLLRFDYQASDLLNSLKNIPTPLAPRWRVVFRGGHFQFSPERSSGLAR